jgi:hypothetical protein
MDLKWWDFHGASRLKSLGAKFVGEYKGSLWKRTKFYEIGPRVEGEDRLIAIKCPNVMSRGDDKKTTVVIHSSQWEAWCNTVEYGKAWRKVHIKAIKEYNFWNEFEYYLNKK